MEPQSACNYDHDPLLTRLDEVGTIIHSLANVRPGDAAYFDKTGKLNIAGEDILKIVKNTTGLDILAWSSKQIYYLGVCTYPSPLLKGISLQVAEIKSMLLEVKKYVREIYDTSKTNQLKHLIVSLFSKFDEAKQGLNHLLNS